VSKFGSVDTDAVDTDAVDGAGWQAGLNPRYGGHGRLGLQARANQHLQSPADEAQHQVDEEAFDGRHGWSTKVGLRITAIQRLRNHLRLRPTIQFLHPLCSVGC
jgi:hypothetical protein